MSTFGGAVRVFVRVCSFLSRPPQANDIEMSVEEEAAEECAICFTVMQYAKWPRILTP